MPALCRITASSSREHHWETLLLTDTIAHCADQCLLCLLQGGPHNGAGLCISHADHE